ncbi:MAG: class I adenylate-forming enzyme family protein [Thermoguttaceae bacterium]|jgi:acyl-CoA synthetase (AMP-forming)/AMP-acid ligase II
MISLSPDAVSRFLDRVQDVCSQQPRDSAQRSIDELACRWRKLGLRPGDLVVLALPNGAELLRQFFGVLAAGGVPALVVPNTPSGQLQDLIHIMGARAVGAMCVSPRVTGMETAATLGEIQVGLVSADRPPAAVPGEVVLLTSGTSGFASGCVFSVEALLLNATRHADSIGQRADDTVLISLPLCFSFALVAQALATLLRGGRLVVGGPPFHLQSYARAIAEHGVTVSSLTPVLVRSLLKSESPLPAGLRVLTVGGDSLPAEEVEQLLRKRPGRELYLTYGLTQCGPRVSTLAAHREPACRYSSVGLPLAGTEVRLKELGDDSAMKQLLVSSATVMRRRIGLVEGRKASDWSSPGVIATGDVFDQEDAGHLYFRGRLSDFVVRDGDKICLAAIRRAAAKLPFILGVKTHVYTRENGSTDFDLTLVADASNQTEAIDYRAQLGRVLRRSEFPRNLRVVAEAGAYCYK